MPEWKWYRHRADPDVRYKARPMPDKTVFAVQTNPDDSKELAYLPAWMFTSPQSIYEEET